MLPMLNKRQELCTTQVDSEDIIPEDKESSSPLPFFREVSFPALEELTLSKISNLTEIWNDKLPEKSYCNLKSLIVEKCPHLVNIISSNLMQVSSSAVVPQLIRLCFVDLPKLRCIWSKYHPWMLSFENLQLLRVKKCASLEYLFTPSMVMGLVRLQMLAVKICAMMKEIVSKEGETTRITLIFPHLSYLCLEDLPNLITFYSGTEENGSNEKLDTVLQPLFNKNVGLLISLLSYHLLIHL